MNVRWDLSGGLFDEPPAVPPVLGEEPTEVAEEDSDETAASPAPHLAGDLSDVTVYVPAHPGIDAGETTVRFELRHTSENELTVVAFTSTEQLVEQLGESQPWVSLPVAKVRDLTQIMGVEIISIDSEIPPDAGRWTEDDIRDFQE